jgi:hypothetical protein
MRLISCIYLLFIPNIFVYMNNSRIISRGIDLQEMREREVKNIIDPIFLLNLIFLSNPAHHYIYIPRAKQNSNDELFL